MVGWSRYSTLTLFAFAIFKIASSTNWDHEKLANLLNGSDALNQEYGKVVRQLVHEFDTPEIIFKFSTAINTVAPFNTPDELAYFLWQAYNHHMPDEEKAFEMMVDLQLQLFRKCKWCNIRNEQYIAHISYYLHKIKKNRFYKTINKKLKETLEKVVSELPSSMQQLYFKPYFCLLNKKYNEYMYTAELMWNCKTHMVFTWADKSWVDVHGIFLSEIHEHSTNTTLLLSMKIRSQQFKSLLYMDRIGGKNIIDGKIIKGTNKNSDWQIELHGDDVVLSHDGYLMCSDKSLRYPYRRDVYGYKDKEHTKASEECQWTLMDCYIH